MDEVSIVDVDLAKQVFQVHGAAADGPVLFSEKLSRSQCPRFMAGLQPCVVANGGLWYGPLLGSRAGSGRP
jgi:transposase